MGLNTPVALYSAVCVLALHDLCIYKKIWLIYIMVLTKNMAYVTDEHDVFDSYCFKLITK